jgi:amino acid adenylation domain-containing protein
VSGRAFQDTLIESLAKFEHRTAIRCGERFVTYGQLDRGSNGIAAGLVDGGIGKGAFIGIYIDDRVAFITAMIGILKAGCVFVPLDAAYPRQRLEAMIRQADVSVIVADAPGVAATLTVPPTVRVMGLDGLTGQPGSEGEAQLPPVAYDPEDRIYIYFTSGTTGQPRAILGKNKSLLHFIDWEIETFHIDGGFRVSQLTTPGFDAFLRDVFVPLSSGGLICIPPDPEILRQPPRLVEWLDRSGIGLIHCVPSLFRLLLTDGVTGSHFRDLKLILLSGERIYPADLKSWFAVFGDRIQLVNFYGPSETTMIKTYYVIRQSDAHLDNIPIGKPMKGARVVIFDEDMNFCDERITGELYIRTPFMSFGYYNDPHLNRQRFIPNPLTGNPHDILYRTGDLARFLPDGNIELLGRIDRQVKIHGIRVELEEIEKILMGQAPVREAAVIQAQVDGGREILMGYFTDNGQAGYDPEQLTARLKAHLALHLPEAAIPASLKRLPQMPRKPNGKVDYDALADLFARDNADVVLPRNSLEKRLAAVWSQVLDIDTVGVTASFFELGGNSLNIMSLLSKIHLEFDVRISLGEIFNNATIEKQAAIIRQAKGEAVVSIEPAEKRDYYIPSSAQKRLYFLQQMEPGSTVYNIPAAFRLAGRLQKERLLAAFKGLIDQHESLRTLFVTAAGETVQRILAGAGFELAYDDAPHLQPSALIAAFVRPFNLSTAPLLRVGLVKLDDNEHLLLVDMHHIVADGLSHQILAQDFMCLYGGQPLPPLRLQYRDFCLWQHSAGQQAAAASQKEYWLKVFGDEIPVLSLPTDFPRPPIQSFDGSRVYFEIPPQETAVLKDMAGVEGATLYMVLLAAYHIFLSKVGNQADIVVGTPVAGRRHPDLQRLIGMFVNTLALRHCAGGELTFKEFVREVKANVLEAFENQEYPFEDLVDQAALKINRDVSRNPLFDVVFVFQAMDARQARLAERESGGIKQRGYEYEERTAKFDLTLDVGVGERLYCSFEYCTRLFTEQTVKRFVGYFRRVVAAVIADPRTRLADIEVLDEEERRQLLHTFNDTAAKYPRQLTIHRCFEQQAARGTGAVALVFAEGQLSYGTLNGRADRLARDLGAGGVTAGVIVPLVLERSLEMIVSILGCLKAGGAYLPIDPAAPPERRQYILDDCGARLVLTDTGPNTLIEGSGAAVSGHREAAPADPAYVIYTSGTTGRPKGMLIEHRSVIRLMFNDRFLFDFGSSDTWTMFHAYHFDFSVWEMYGALLYGGKLIVIPAMTARDPAAYLEILQRQQVSVLNQTPSAFYNLSEAEFKRPTGVLSLKYVIFGGEALKPVKLKKWRRRYPRTRLVNMFGITETTVHVTFKEIGEEEIEHNISNIGGPIPTLSTYVLDEHLRLLPLKTAGELCVAGDGVGRGYLNRPGLTAEKMLPNPFKPAERLYRSGDLARQLMNGDLEYLGRIDHQVQLRGFRIEPGEIEDRLVRHPEVKAAVVMDREDAHGDRYLTAYIVPNPTSPTNETSPAKLRQYLAETLPAYMIPAYFVQLAALPLTANGKVDYKALPEYRADDRDNYRPPENPLQQQLADIWAAVLGVERVGIGDNYFSIGGDSIKAIRLLNDINARLDTNLKIVDLFSHDTVEKMAQLIAAGYAGYRAAPRVSPLIQEVEQEIEGLKQRIMADYHAAADLEDIYPMSDIQKGMLFYSLKDEALALYHEQFVYQWAYRDFDKTLFERALSLMADKHPTLRTAFNVDDFEEPVQMVYRRAPLAWEHEDISALDRPAQEAHIRQIIGQDRQQPFDISRPPLWRMKTFAVAPDSILTVWIFHHAILDGWSNASFITELNNMYLALKSDAGFVPQRLKSSYRDFVVQEMVEKRNEASARFWQQELTGYRRLDFSGLGEESGGDRLNTVAFNWGPTFFRKLQRVARHLNTGVKTLCLAAYIYALDMLSFDGDILSGLVTNNRPEAVDGDKILGCFLNTVPVRVKIPEPITWADYIGLIDKKLAALKRHERLSLFKIVRLTGEKTQEANPLFDTLFNYVDFFVFQGAERDAAAGAGGQKAAAPLSVEGYENTNTRFDFNVNTTGGGFYVSLAHFESLIGDRMARYVCRCYRDILDTMAAEPTGMVRRDCLLAPEEKQKILYPEAGSPACVHRLFEAQAEKIPDCPAVVHGPRQLTYGELDRRTDGLALTMREKGIGTGAIVGIIARRSLEMVVAILGVFKTGAAYLPIDPGYPPARIRYLLEESRARAVLRGEEIELLIREGEAGADVEGEANPSTLAYVLYTSGSTGKPKGVLVNHGAIMNTLLALFESYPFGWRDVYLLKTAYVFDVSVSELFGWFLGGGRLAVLEREGEKDPQAIYAAIHQHDVTHINFVPSMFGAFVEFLALQEGADLASLRYIFLAGEALPPQMIYKFRQHNNWVVVENIYGPTEAAIYASQYPLAEWQGESPVPIGRPLKNMNLFVLNHSGHLQPMGVRGELCIAGPGLARGYLNEPELTADKFVNFNLAAKSREDTRSPQNTKSQILNPKSYILYRTGDLVRWLADGNIEFLGRIDHQVKIRGFRVEPGEVESRLLTHHSVRDAVVACREDDRGDTFLAAYVVLSTAGTFEDAPVIAELKEHLNTELPDYMIPAHFVFLEAIPLNPSGKVDRKALPEPAGLWDTAYTAPQDKMQERVAAIWSEVLGIETARIGIDTNFFDLGGHSLKATVLTLKIHKALNVKVSLAKIFKAPTIRGLAQILEEAAADRYVAIEPVEQREYYPLSSAQNRIYIVQQMDPSAAAYNISAVLPLDEEPDRQRMAQTFDSLIRRHQGLRTSFTSVKGEPVQRVHGDVEFEIEVYDAPRAQLPTLIPGIVRPFDLSHAPLLRVALVRHGADEHTLVVDVHHIIADALSLVVIEEDYIDLYRGKGLPQLKLHYKDFAIWQQRYGKSPGMQNQQHFWLDEFKGDIPILNLPTDFDRPKVQTFAGAGSLSLELEASETTALKELARAQSATPYMLFLALFNTLLFKLTNQQDIVVGTPAAGRRHADLERIIGMFVNTLPLRNYPAADKGFGDFLEEVRDRTVAAFDNQDYPFEDLVEQLGVKRDIARNPLFDTLFNFITLEPAQAVDDAEQKAQEYERNEAQFYLIFGVEDGGSRFEVGFGYSTQLFKEDTVERFMAYFREIVASVLKDPDIKLGDIEIAHDLKAISSDLYIGEENTFEF